MRNLIAALLAVLLPLGIPTAARALPLSSGDRVKVTIPEGEEFSGIFEVNLSGELELPYVRGIRVTGLEPDQVEQRIHQALVAQGYFQPSFLRVSVNVVQWAPVEVFVSGSTFQPGRVLINEWSDAEQTQTPVQQAGQAPFNRLLSSAIRQAGGVTPTADVKDIALIRGGRRQTIDLSGIFTGQPFKDIPLIAGDQVIVPDTGTIDPILVRPSQITPVGVKIFISNLTVPAAGNAVAAIGRDATSFPYGSRFSQAVVSGNCAGGALWTNARRKAVLVRTNAETGETKVLERPVEDLLRKSTDNENNPYLMANDAVACYDSGVTNFRDILGVIRDFVVPGALIYDVISP
jgi:polysaccharide export outer membrane protein